jgi:polyhydroxyalkanoate synthesis regulator phasin
MAEPADPRAGSLRELLSQISGRDSVARERARAALDDLVTAGKLAREDADALLEDLQGTPGALGWVGDRASDALSALADQLGLVRERQLAEVELRIAQLEHRVRLLERTADDEAGGSLPPV